MAGPWSVSRAAVSAYFISGGAGFGWPLDCYFEGCCGEGIAGLRPNGRGSQSGYWRGRVPAPWKLPRLMEAFLRRRMPQAALRGFGGAAVLLTGLCL